MYFAIHKKILVGGKIKKSDNIRNLCENAKFKTWLNEKKFNIYELRRIEVHYSILLNSTFQYSKKSCMNLQNYNAKSADGK